MDRKQKEAIALFRFGVIHPLVGVKDAELLKKEPLIQDTIAKEWEIPYSPRTRICRATLLSWINRYQQSGNNLESLFPKDRSDAGVSRKVDKELELTLINLKSGYPTASLPTLLKIAKSRKIISETIKVSDQTIYRILRKNAPLFEKKITDDSRKFESELPNDLWQSDCMHGPSVIVEGKLHKAYLFAIIDDHSRLITHAQFYLNENIDAYIHCLETALAKRGLPRKLYLDNGAAFRSHQLRYTTASLGIALIHATPYRPQGKGKIERWFKTVRTTWLPVLPQELTLDILNEKLAHWIDTSYHRSLHSTIKETPLDRYQKNIHLIRQAPPKLRDYFRKRIQRKVNRDRTISFFGKEYEAPISVIGKTVTLLYHDGDISRIEVFDKDQSVGFLSMLDPHINVQIKRTNHYTEFKQQATPPSETPQYGNGQLFAGGNENGTL